VEERGVRRLTAGEIAAVAAELGALPVRWTADPTAVADRPDAGGPAGPTATADPASLAGLAGLADVADPADPDLSGPASPGGRSGVANPSGATGRAEPIGAAETTSTQADPADPHTRGPGAAANPPSPARPGGGAGRPRPAGTTGSADPGGPADPANPTGTPGTARTETDPTGSTGRDDPGRPPDPHVHEPGAAANPTASTGHDNPTEPPNPHAHQPAAAADPASPAGPGTAPADPDGPPGAGDVADPVAAVAAAQQADSLAGAVASLLVAIVWGRPFDRRNAAVGVAAADLLARLNGHVLVLEPADGTMALVGRVRAGLPVTTVRDWLTGRLIPDLGPQPPPVTAPAAVRVPLVVRRPHRAPVPPSAGPARARCPRCAMPLRESLTALVLPAGGGGGGTTLAACGGCGGLLARPHQEV
jgi:hypothetical protein